MACQRILLMEDNEDHILIAKRILAEQMPEVNIDCISAPEEGLKKILENSFDVILCDYNMPRLTALDILQQLRQQGNKVPFIVVTAAGSEKVAVELMKAGASDYIIKDASYEDALPLVIQRVVSQDRVQKEKDELEKKIKRAAYEWEVTFNSISDWIVLYDQDFRVARINKAFAEAYCLNLDIVIGKKIEEVVHVENNVLQQFFQPEKQSDAESSRIEFFETALMIHLELSESMIVDEQNNVVGVVHIFKDITSRKKTEAEIEANLKDLKQFREIAVGRETKMIDLKKEVNQLSKELGRAEPYDVLFAD